MYDQLNGNIRQDHPQLTFKCMVRDVHQTCEQRHSGSREWWWIGVTFLVSPTLHNTPDSDRARSLPDVQRSASRDFQQDMIDRDMSGVDDIAHEDANLALTSWDEPTATAMQVVAQYDFSCMSVATTLQDNVGGLAADARRSEHGGDARSIQGESVVAAAYVTE